MIIIKSKKVLLCTIYISPLVDMSIALESLSEHLAIVGQEYPSLPLIVGGDFNARISDHNIIDEQTLQLNSGIYYCRDSLDMTLNNRGNSLIKFMEEWGLYVLNGRVLGDCPAQYTYVSNVGKSVIDLVWGNEAALDLTIDLKVLTIPVQSDHFPVVLEISNDVEFETYANQKEKISWKTKLSIDYYTNMLYSNNVSDLNDNLNLLNTNITKTISDIAKQVGMVKTVGKSAASKPWNSKECKSAKKTMRNKLKICTEENFSSESVESYVETKKTIY